jgi:hypothetical protein
MFRRADKNNDGVLDADEMTESLLAEKEKWDTNKDGVIDLTEYKAYFAARMQQIQRDREGMNPFGPNQPEQDEDHKPVVYRSGKLPRELPAWFAQLDTDQDMQIGLYEWKKSGRSIKEFRDMDRNGDNFLTIDEVLYYIKTKANSNAVASAGNPAAGPGPGNGPGGPNGMRFQMPGMPQGDQNPRGNRSGGGMFPQTGGGMVPQMGGGAPGGDRRGRGDRQMGPGAPTVPGSPTSTEGAPRDVRDKSGYGRDRPAGSDGSGGRPKGMRGYKGAQD